VPGPVPARSPRLAFAVREVLLQQAREWEPVFTRADRRLEVALPPASSTVLAAPGPVGQALSTLLENALVHGAGTVRVRVRVRAETGSAPEWVVVEVSDEGPGVPAALAGRIFERRVSGARGTGLGLAVARDLVVAEGGRLELVRRAPAAFGIFLRRG